MTTPAPAILDHLFSKCYNIKVFGLFSSPKDIFYNKVRRATIEADIKLEKLSVSKQEKIVLRNILANGCVFPSIYSQNFKNSREELLISPEDFENTKDTNPEILLGIFCSYFLFTLFQMMNNIKDYCSKTGIDKNRLVDLLGPLVSIDTDQINSLLEQFDGKLSGSGGDIRSVYLFFYSQPLPIIFGEDKANKLLSVLSSDAFPSLSVSLTITQMFDTFASNINKELGI